MMQTVERDFLFTTPTGLPVHAYIALACQKYRVGQQSLAGPSRDRSTVVARDEAIYRARKEGGHTLKQIGAVFGGRDHSTVHHAIRRHEQRLKAGTNDNL